jgi:hypothetical protein
VAPLGAYSGFYGNYRRNLNTTLGLSIDEKDLLVAAKLN